MHDRAERAELPQGDVVLAASDEIPPRRIRRAGWKPDPDRAQVDRRQREWHQAEPHVPDVAVPRIAGTRQVVPDVTRGDCAKYQAAQQNSPQYGHSRLFAEHVPGTKRYQQERRHERQQDQPVQKKIANDRTDDRPRVARDGAKLRRQIVAVSSKVSNWCNVRIEEGPGSSRQLTNRFRWTVGSVRLKPVEHATAHVFG